MREEDFSLLFSLFLFSFHFVLIYLSFLILFFPFIISLIPHRVCSLSSISLLCCELF